MTRPRALRGLLWRLALAYPKHALGAMLVGVFVLCLAAISRGSDASPCHFEQTWFAGDQHYYERLEIRAEASGIWNRGGGFEDDPGRQQKEFRWQRTASTLTVTYDGNRHKTVEYRIERRDETCYLTFKAHPFLADWSGFLQFSDEPGFATPDLADVQPGRATSRDSRGSAR